MMNNTKKIAAFTLAAALAFSASGCADQSWSYKTDSVSLSTGTYLYNLLNGYYEAADLIESPDEVKGKDKLKAEVKKETDDELKTVEQYSYDVADETTMRMIAVEELFKSYDLVLDETEDTSARSYASQVWSSAKKMLEGYGISEESFTYCYADYSVKYGQVFEYLYGEKGEKYVTDDDLREYFNDNYVGYAYFSVRMADTDEEGNSVAKSDEEMEKADKDLASYVDMINKDGKTYFDAVSAYIKEYSVGTDPTYSGAFKKGENATGLDDATSQLVVDMKEGEAKYVRTGEGATTVFYFLYRPYQADLEDYLNESNEYTSKVNDDGITIYDIKSGYSRYSLIDEMKGDEFKDYLKDYANSLDVKKNTAALKKYSPKLFISEDTDE